MKPNWIAYVPAAGTLQMLPKERRYVLCQTARIEYDDFLWEAGVVVGYLRLNNDGTPYWVTPGGKHGEVTHWADCLGNDFEAPSWKGKQSK